jgi:hypothetical protein
MKLSAEKQNFLIDLYLKKVSEVESVQLPEDLIEVNDFLSLAEQNKVGANLYLQLKRLVEKEVMKLPENLLNGLEETYRKVKAKNIRRLETGLPVLIELKKRGVEVIILKGNAIAEEIYGDIGYKPMNDIDILVKKKDMPIVYEVFASFYLLTAAPLDTDIKKQEKFSHHAPPFFNRSLEVFFGTHWDIAAPTRGLSTPVADFWKNKEEFSLMGETFYRLSPMHFIFHLCIHLSPAKTGLREVADIVKMIEHRQKDLDAKTFVQMVRESKSSEEVYEALTIVNALSEFSFVREVLKELDKKVSESVKEQARKRATPRNKILHIRTNYVSKIEKTFALFSLTESPVEKTFLLAKMWRLYLFVPPSEALRLNYDFQDVSFFKKCWVTLIAPLKVSEVFIKDLGLMIFLIVTARHQWVLLKSYGYFMINKLRGKPVANLESFAQKLGMSFKEIKDIQALD